MTALIDKRFATGPLVDGSLRRWARLARPVAAALLIGGALPAMAADPLVVPGVNVLTPTVTFSRVTPPLATYAAYEVSFVNNSTNTLNNVRLVGSTDVVNSSLNAPFAGSIGLTCTTTDTAHTAIECLIGQLRGGGGSSSFIVLFQAPPVQGTGVDQFINLNWQFFYGEGASDSSGASHADSTTPATASVTLGTPIATELKTYVPPGGGTFYTGAGLATPTDPWTTTLNVPKTAKVEVLEDPSSPIPIAADLLSVETSNVSIPGVSFDGDPLKIWLVRDASTIAKGAKISSAKIYYTGSNPPSLGFYPYQVLPCTDTTYGPLPKPGIPCIKTRTEFTKKTAPTPDWVGDWQFEIRALDNGKYTQ